MILGVLRDVEPDNHLLDCPGTVVIPGPIPEPIPDPAGNGRWIMLKWSVQCGHGTHAFNFSTHAHIVKNPEETDLSCPVCGSTNVKPSSFGDGYWECKEPTCGADWKPKASS